MDGSVLELLERALNQSAAVIAQIRPGQAGLPTPCTDWDVEHLVRHLVVQDLPHFTVAARGEAPDWTSPPGELGADWPQQFRRGARLLLVTWAAADLDQPVALPGGGQAPLRSRADQQIAELAVHGWDLARATSAGVDLDPALAEHALAWSRGMLRPEFRGPGKVFGVEIPVPAESPAYDRLAGWFGRDPAWTPAAFPA
ncbi:TIGR03086 family metal-binding protein [Pseudarthrobacter sp. H2]|uniref:TIGR03086 family metal-binding protein n=1 Tax=Pseudarthrobacter sp. H2 TaxID=3418415 RepID=UPI003CEA611C